MVLGYLSQEKGNNTMKDTLRDLLEGTIENEPFKIYQLKSRSRYEYLNIDLSKDQALLYLSDEFLDTPAKFTDGYYGINYVQLLELK